MQNAYKIVIFCQFIEECANGILMRGRAQALSELNHRVCLVYQPFKYSAPQKSYKKKLSPNFVKMAFYSRVFTAAVPFRVFCLVPFLLFDAIRVFFIMRTSHIVFLHKPLPLSLFYTILLKMSFYRGKLVCILDDWEGVGGFASLRNADSFLNKAIVTLSEEWVPLKVNGLHCVSKLLFMKMKLSRHTAHKCIYLPNGAAGVPADGNEGAPAGRGFVVGYVGTFKSPWLIRFLVETIKATAAIADEISFVFVGGGDLLSDFKTKCGQEGLEKHVRFTDQVPSHEVNKYIRSFNAVLLVLNPDFPETYIDASRSSTKLFEYMALGKIILCSNVGEPKNVLENNVTGFLLPNKPGVFAEKIVSVKQNANAWIKMGDSVKTVFLDNYEHGILMGKLLDWIKTLR